MHRLPELGFAHSALEPFLSGDTISFHYGKHHAGYVKKLNTLLAGTPFADLELNALMAAIAVDPTIRSLSTFEQIRFNALQHFNHSAMWSLIGPDRRPPPEGLIRLVGTRYGVWENFEKSFLQAAISLIGSGWVYVTLSRDGTVDIEVLPNGDNPIIKMDSDPKAVLLLCDMWEHSYYLDYQNDKEAYLRAFLKIVDWSAVFSRTMSMFSLFSQDRF